MNGRAIWFMVFLPLLAQPERQFAEMKVFDAQGSPLRTPREDWAGAKERLAREPVWREWAAQQRREVDEWMARRRDRVEWVAGWWHDFVSPRDGSFLTWTPEEPGEWTLSSPSDPRVQLTPKLQRAWVFGFRSRHAQKMEQAAALWRLTGEEKYADWAAAQLDFYAGNYEKWPLQTERNPARLMHQSLDEAVNLVRYVRAARWLEGYLAPERKKAWIEKLFLPEASLLAGSMQRIHNIACWQRSAQALVGLYAQDEAVWRAAVEGEFGIRDQVRRGITGDFLWLEQSLGYNNYVVTALLPFFTGASLAGRAAEFREEMARVQNLLLAPTYLRFPDGKLPTPADTTGAFLRAPNAAAMAAAYRVFPTWIGLAEAARSRSLDTLIDPPGATNEPPPLPEVRSWHLTDTKMMLLRKNGWQVFFHYGQIDASHAQAEALNYEAYYDGIDITHDAGTVGYGSPLHRGFYTTAWAHNVPVIDGAGQQRWQPGEAIEWNPKAGRMAAAQPSYREDIACERRIEITGNRLKDRVVVRAKDGKPRAIGLLLHLQGHVTAPESWEAVESPVPYGSQARRGELSESVEFPVRFQDRPFRVRISAPGEYTVYHLVTPDAPPRERETLYFVVNSKASAEFSIEIEPPSTSALKVD